MSFDLAVVTPAFLDLTFVGLEALPEPGQERFAGGLLRSPGGGAITAIGAARLGLDTALVAPLGEDVAGDFVATELERDSVTVLTRRGPRMPTTVVMPTAGERAMVTYDPGVRAQPADIAAVEPRAVAAGLDQLDLVPPGLRAYVTCGDDDARAFAGRLPARLGAARALFVNRREAIVLTGADTPVEAAERLATVIGTVVVTLGAEGAIAIVEGDRVEAAGFEVGPVVDSTGAGDLLCAAFAWTDLNRVEPHLALRWSVLYAALSITVPTGAAGAATYDRLMEEGARRGLEPLPELTGTGKEQER
jgi:sugar/nucleoside kinase (ribokinase family)